jgi:hypothetical protein
MTRPRYEAASWLLPVQLLFGLRRPPLTRLGSALLAAGLLALFAAFLQSALDIQQYGGIDLRPKVVGARCLWTGRDPYTYEWQPGEPDIFLDPVKRSPGLSRVTVPPTLLLFYSPVAWLPYGVQRWLWFALEWSALVASIALLARLVGRRRRLLFVILALLFFAASSFWRLHVERGQYYVFILLALAASAFLTVARRDTGWWPGILIGLAVALRPTILVIPVLLFAAGRFRLALSAAATAAVCVLATLPLGGISTWRSYVELVDGWGRVFTDFHYMDKRFGPARPIPDTAEGVALVGGLPDNSSNTTLHAIYRMLVGDAAERGIDFDIHTVAKLCMAGVLAAGLVWMMAVRRRSTLRLAFAVAVMVTLLAEFFLPTRVGYADVVYLLPLALLMRRLFPDTIPSVAAVILLFGLTASQIGLLGTGFATWLRWLLVVGALTAVSLRMGARRHVTTAKESGSPVAAS